MHIDEEILEHLRAKEYERQREIKLRAESLDRYMQASQEELHEALKLMSKACQERDRYKKIAIAAVVVAVVALAYALSTTPP